MATNKSDSTVFEAVVATMLFGSIGIGVLTGYLAGQEHENKRTYNSKEQVWSSLATITDSQREFLRIEVGNNALEATANHKSGSWVFLDDKIDGTLDFVAVLDYHKYPLYFSIQNNPEEINELQQVFETVKSKAYSHIPPSYDLIELMRRKAEK